MDDPRFETQTFQLLGGVFMVTNTVKMYNDKVVRVLKGSSSVYIINIPPML